MNWYFREAFRRLAVTLGNRRSRPLKPPLREHGSFGRTGEGESMSVTGNRLLSGKNVLITGGGRNIGRSIALEMAQHGANVFFTDIVNERCMKLEGELNDCGVRAKGFLSDISRTKDIDLLHNNLVRENICVDILVNNAGIQFQRAAPERFYLDQWHAAFNTNVIGPMYLTHRIADMMMVKGIRGCIIFVTSIHQFTVGRSPSYSSSKAALGMIIKELSLDLAPYGIRVNGIAPGWVAEDEKRNAYGFGAAPLHHSSIGPDYIGRAAVYLSAEYFSKFTTGTVLVIDAGLSLCNYLADLCPPDEFGV